MIAAASCAFPDALRELVSECRSQFSVGEVSVQLEVDRSDEVTLVPPLEPFRIETDKSNITIQVEQVPQTVFHTTKCCSRVRTQPSEKRI